MIEVLLLVLVSMVVGGVIASRAGMKGLSISLIGICLMIAFYGGKLGILVGAIGILSILLLWFLSDFKKPISLLYNAKPLNNIENSGHKSKRSLSEGYKQSFQAGLRKKYPDEFRENHQKTEKRKLIDVLRNNLRVGLAEKYPAK